MGGVHIGHGAIIAAYSVVGRDVPPYAVMAGNPAEILRYRFSKPTVEALLRIAWWDWSADTIRSRLEWFFKPVNEFIRQFES
jgi:virginiamycin A acetyltransferase